MSPEETDVCRKVKEQYQYNNIGMKEAMHNWTYLFLLINFKNGRNERLSKFYHAKYILVSS